MYYLKSTKRMLKSHWVDFNLMRMLISYSIHICSKRLYSTSSQKSDVTIVFPDPDFLWRERILAIRP